ncbi:sensor histidine kinase [Amycolatopsis sp. NPDC098790]|uniref:sensor histidine kinase n=1 Tax=Amycolatopsis sp. NPDC098790 TaxID=3363939 RepID=UPI00381C1705
MVRSLVWALVTGKDGDLLPPARWWRGPEWLKALGTTGLLALLAATSYSAWSRYLDGDLPLVFALLALQALPLPLAGRHPLTALRLAGLGMLVACYAVRRGLPGPGAGLADWPLQTQFLPYLPLLALVLARTRGREGAGIAAVAVLLAAATGIVQEPRAGAKTLVWALIVAVTTIAVGYALQQRRRALTTADEERGKRTVLEERTRIARELHDIVGHHLTLITLRADSAPHRVPDVSEAAAAELRALGQAAREALEETRRLVGVLREEGARPERAPQPGAAELPRLVERCRESGLDVRARLEVGEPPGTVGLAVYRIVQEALSNARRHSPGSAVSVDVTRAAGTVSIVVENGPAERTPPPGRGDGTGLAGIAERAGSLGGTYEAGPRPDGGFRLAVTLATREEVAP